MTADLRSIMAICVAIVPAVALAQDAADPRLALVTAIFAEADVVSGPEIVSCTLSGGTQTECAQIAVVPVPPTRTPGPWCPRDISDGPEAGGIWLDGGEVHDVDGAFITSLPDFYDDPNWQLYDPETGRVRVTETFDACQAAARPDVAEEYQNHCVECAIEDVGEIALTYVIPLEPVLSDEPVSIRESGAGVAYDGVRLDAPAPVDAILSAYTIAAFDDCGGHVNPVVGYHYHAVTDCLEGVSATVTDEGPVIGIAMDGHPILPGVSPGGAAPQGLDDCRGHDTGTGYHYHAGEPGGNAILPCLMAEAGCALSEAGPCDASAVRGPGGGRPPRQ